jgi:hypothetical protein
MTPFFTFILRFLFVYDLLAFQWKESKGDPPRPPPLIGQPVLIRVFTENQDRWWARSCMALTMSWFGIYFFDQFVGFLQ